MKKILIILFVFIFSLYLIPPHVFAENNFTTDYSVTYNVLENALTHVTFNITLANKTSQYYASSYGIQVGFKNIENVLASDNGGKITPQISKNDDGNNIEIVFNVNVIVPKFLGNPVYIKPDTGKPHDNNLIFTKEELGESGISMSFGKEQIYNFNLLYHLKNSNLFPVKTEIALPPSTNYQDVQIFSIEPSPQNVTRDIDGNWLAQYILAPGKKIDITVNGKAKIWLNPRKEQLSDTELKEYVKEQPYWETNKKEIKDLALKLKTPYAIYQYVVNTLTYDYNRAQENQPRDGAYGVLKNPSSAVCLE